MTPVLRYIPRLPKAHASMQATIFEGFHQCSLPAYLALQQLSHPAPPDHLISSLTPL